jgi:serine/threonine protein kinase
MPLASGAILHDRYRITRLLAQGGWGAIYGAWDRRANRPCVLKEIFEVSPADLERFTQAAARWLTLEHPNLPKVFETFVIPSKAASDSDKQPRVSSAYLVMDFVEGEDLRQMLERTGEPLSETQALAWIIQVCDALTYLHSQNPPIFHGDIKPANIKITPSGKAVLVDLSIIQGSSLAQTVTGERASTPGFSPPEKYDQGAIEARSDVYGLGATLYTLLTRQVPPDSSDIWNERIPPPPPANKCNPTVSPAVSAVIEHAMQLEKSARFSSMAEFKTAILEATSSLPVPQVEISTSAKPTSGDVDSSQRHAKPTPTDVDSSQATINASHGELPEQPAADRRATRRPEETSASGGLQRRVPWAAVLGGLALLALIVIAVLVVPRFFLPASATPLNVGMSFTDTPLPAATSSPTLAADTPTAMPLPSPTSTASQTPLPPTDTPPPPSATPYASPTPLTALTSSYSFPKHPAGMNCLAFSPDGNILASGTADNLVILWDAHTGTQVRNLEGHTAFISDLAFSPDGTILASASEDKTIILWNALTGERLRLLEGHKKAVTGLAFSPDGQLLASSSRDSTVNLWKPDSGELVKTLVATISKDLEAGFSNVSFSADGVYLVGGSTGAAVLWAVDNLRQVNTIGTDMSKVAFSGQPVDAVLKVMVMASGAKVGTVNMWTIPGGERVRSLYGHKQPITSLAFSPDGTLLASASKDGIVILWDLQSATILRTLEGGADAVTGLAFSPDGATLASSSADGIVTLWAIQSQ